VALPGTTVRVKRGAAYPELTPDDLFDRIINLKFVRWDGSSFVIRSDYEPVFQKDGSVRFIVCRQKPHIKISYKQVSQTTAISVDIEVANLFIDKSQGDPWIVQDSEFKDMLDPGQGNPVTNIVVQLGYRAQFPDWTERQYSEHPDLYYDLYNHYIPRGRESKSGMQVIVTVLDAYPKGNPPDQVIYFHGIIGSSETGLRWTHTEDELIKTAEDFDIEKNGKPFLWQELYQWITRRFVRPDILHRVVTAYEKQREGGKKAWFKPVQKIEKQRVFVYGLTDLRKNLKPPAVEGWQLDALAAAPPPRDDTAMPADSAAAPEPDTKWGELTLVNGMLSDEDALLFGLPCRLSAKLLQEAMPEKPSFGEINEDSDELLPHEVVMSDLPQNTLSAQIAALCNAYSFLRYYVLPDGSYYFYHEDEQKEDLFMNTRIAALREAANGEASYAVRLPAVYDIEYGGTRTIRCPFYYLIAPMTVVYFQARYFIGSTAGFYYYPEKKDAKYLVLQVSAEFSTDDDDNTMTLMCVDYPDTAPPFITSGEPVFSLTDEDKKALAKPPAADGASWEEITAVAVRAARGESARISVQNMNRWLDIARKCLILPLGYPDGLWWRGLWADYQDKDEAWVHKRALEDLASWNPDLFTDDRLRDPSPENAEWQRITQGAEGGPVTAVPRIYPGEEIIFRYPWRPGYEGKGRTHE
jgi:hypothetical protein